MSIDENADMVDIVNNVIIGCKDGSTKTASGLKALKPIPKGVMIGEYYGMLYKPGKAPPSGPETYKMDVTLGINNQGGGNLHHFVCVAAGNCVMKFANHRCRTSNVSVEKKFAFGATRTVFVTKRNIQQGEDLTIKYAMSFDGPEQNSSFKTSLWACTCGDEGCRGLAGPVGGLEPEDAIEKYGLGEEIRRAQEAARKARAERDAAKAKK